MDKKNFALKPNCDDPSINAAAYAELSNMFRQLEPIFCRLALLLRTIDQLSEVAMNFKPEKADKFEIERLHDAGVTIAGLNEMAYEIHDEEIQGAFDERFLEFYQNADIGRAASGGSRARHG